VPMADHGVVAGKRTVAGTFSRLREQGKTAFIPFITAGDPDLATTSKALKILDSCGSDVIEVGVPYSDPLADGPVIQASATRALKKGTTLESVIGMLKGVAPELSCPIVLFTYYNPILKRGVRNFMATIRQAGINGKFPYIASHADYGCFILCYYKMFLLASSVSRKHDLHLIQTFFCCVSRIC